MKTKTLLIATGILLSAWLAAAQAQVTVVNMIPNARSAETSQDSEPNVAVDPANPQRIAGSAFTPDPLGGPNAPIYVSTNGGLTWTLNSILPGNGPFGTGDITQRFGGTSHALYSGILRGGAGLRLHILRTTDFTLPNVMTILVDRNSVDQPYVQATTVLGGAGIGFDRVYVGNNDFGSAPHTASIDRSLDGLGATPPPPSNFGHFPIETRPTAPGVNQDGPPIRPIYHWDGTIYAIFYGWRAFTGNMATTDVVVVRDDNWAAGANPFTALVDPGDLLAGRQVLTGVRVPWANVSQAAFGQERFVGSNISIAVDPRDSSRVYIAWADYPGGVPPYTLHVRRSDDRGVNWTGDLITVANATNPALAVNTHGRVGFLYQQVVGSPQRWETHLRRSANLGGLWNDMILANVPATTPAPQFIPYIGDYVHLQAVGKDFYGIFSANNTPNLANFPQGVIYQRNANFGTQTLLNLSNQPVAISIDPFFFRVVEVAAGDDFYVRDWTDSPASGDTGLEPSTHPIFYTTSDVWNRRNTNPGTFPNDQPENQPAGNGFGIIGDNWAFARIRRNATSSATQTVTAHFLVSKLGTGSNYVDNTVMDPDVVLPGADPTVTFLPAELGPKNTPAYYWHLNPVNSSHLCLAVEISTPNDPYVAPSLRGYAPGWPVTDLRVLLDNNKAQRNLSLSTTPAGTPRTRIRAYAIAHNAATFPRTATLRYTVDPKTAERLAGGAIEVLGAGGATAAAETSLPLETSGTITIPDLQPGENRWIGIDVPAPAGKEGEVLTVDFQDIVLDQPIDGFSLGVRLGTNRDAIGDLMELHRSVYTRLSAGFGIDAAKTEADAADEAKGRGAFSEEDYTAFLAQRLPAMSHIDAEIADLKSTDPFATEAELALLNELATRRETSDATVGAHVSYLNKLDALLTLRQIEQGDVADILQNVRWQRDLYIRAARLAGLDVAGKIVQTSRAWVAAYEIRKANNRDYGDFLKGLLQSFDDTAKELGEDLPGLTAEVQAIESAVGSGNLAALQKAHRAFLLRLQTLDAADVPAN